MGCPCFIIAGTQSGVGKTSLTLSIVRALTRRGLRVQTYKVGPDFLDPTYLSRASGRPCYNLDSWMSDASYVRALVERASRDADLSVVEGAMGLFDGADATSSKGSAAEIAVILGAPVLLVVDAHGMARSIAATVTGYANFEKNVRIAGVLANRVGSDRHARWLADALKAEGLPPILGATRRDGLPALPSRHLGLVTADRDVLPDDMLEALADAAENAIALDDVIAAARPSIDGAVSQCPRQFPGLRVAVAYDAAFHFYYQDFFDALESRGCEVIRFSPMRDSELPGAVDLLYLGGGYPEEHAETLAANAPMLEAIRAYAASGRPLYAECGGLVYLSQGIERLDGERHAFVGVAPSWTRMLERRKALGYVAVRLQAETLIGSPGDELRGHEFHYSELVTDPAQWPGWEQVYTLRKRRSDTVQTEGYCRGAVLASYVHLHLASRPAAIDALLSTASRAKATEGTGVQS